MKLHSQITETGDIPLTPIQKERLRKFVGKYVEIEILKSLRSGQQNNYLWGIVYKTIAEHTGNTVQELHEVFKRMFLEPQYIDYKGKKVKVPQSTTRLTKVEFGEYLERIFAEAGSMGIHIPEPKDLEGFIPNY